MICNYILKYTLLLSRHRDLIPFIFEITTILETHHFNLLLIYKRYEISNIPYFYCFIIKTNFSIAYFISYLKNLLLASNK